MYLLDARAVTGQTITVDGGQHLDLADPRHDGRHRMSAEVLVLIRNLEVLSRIGVHGHEQGKPQPVRINVALTARSLR